MSAEILRKAAEAIRFDASDSTGPWSLLPDDFGPAVADWLEEIAGWRTEFDTTGGAGHRIPTEEQALAVARLYLGVLG